MKYHLHIKFKKDSGLPEFLQRYFEGDYEVTESRTVQENSTPKESWLYTFVSLRRGMDAPVAGCTIANPHDNYNDEIGYRNAFKRAVEALWRSKIVLNLHKKEVVDKFRYARYNALKQLDAEKGK